MALTNFPNGITSFGVPFAGGLLPIVGIGDVYWCDPVNGLDANSGESPDAAKKTLSAVHTAMTANRNDTVIVLGNSSASASTTVRETATLTWSKSLCHIIGTAYNRISHRVSLRMTGDFTPQVTISASGCVFANFHMFDSGTDATQTQLNLTGERNAFYNIHFGGLGSQTAADAAGAMILKIVGSGGEHYFKDCVIGLDTVDRGAANSSLICTSGTPRNAFENCQFIMRADAATPWFLTVGTGGIDRTLEFKGCRFYNALGSGATSLNEAFNIGASAGGMVTLIDSHQACGGDWEATASNQLYVEGAQAEAASGTGVMALAVT